MGLMALLSLELHSQLNILTLNKIKNVSGIIMMLVSKSTIECVHQINCFGSDLINWSQKFQVVYHYHKLDKNQHNQGTKASTLITNEIN